MKKSFALGVAVALISITTSTISAQQCENQVKPYPQMGINFPAAHMVPYINIWNQFNPWQSLVNDRTVFDSDGWPTAGRTNRIIFGKDVDIQLEAGVYKIAYKGTLSQVPFAVEGGSWGAGKDVQRGTVQNVRANYPYSGYSYFEIDFPQPPYEIWLRIEGRIEDIRFMRPGYEVTDTRKIRPEWLALLEHFSTIRFMQYLNSNNHYIDPDDKWNCPTMKFPIYWEDRADPNLPPVLNMRKNKGGSWESIVEICNETDKDMWINIPVIASDDYIRELAKMLKENVKPTLNINIEIGNEMWNVQNQFCCFRQIVDYHCGENWSCHQELPAKFLKNTIDIFADVWGWDEINNRIRAILCGQSGYGVVTENIGWSIGTGIGWMEENLGYESVSKYLYAVGATNYVGIPDNPSIQATHDEVMRIIREEKFGEFSDEARNGVHWGNQYEQWLARAGQHGLKIYAYEGGPHPAWDITDNQHRAITDPGFVNVMDSLLIKWYNRFGYDALMCFFGSWIHPKRAFTLTEGYTITSTRQIAMNKLMTNPAPPFDTTIRHIIPGDIDARKVSGYSESWDNNEGLGNLKPPTETGWGGSKLWTFAAEKNGTYSLSILRENRWDGNVDIFIDGKKIYSNLLLPKTGDTWDEPHLWSADQGVTIEMDLAYGLHVMKIAYLNNNGGFYTLRFSLKEELPPFPPERVMGNLTACLGNPVAEYYVDIDESACEYYWDEALIRAAGAQLVSPSGGAGLDRIGQGSNKIQINWAGVPEGTYPLRMRSVNLVDSSEWTDFIVTVQKCGFTASPAEGCVNEPITFTPLELSPEEQAEIKEWQWDFGPGSEIRYVTKTTADPVQARYPARATPAVILKLVKNDNSSQSFINAVSIGDPLGGTASATPTTVAAGETTTLTVEGIQGSIVAWQKSTDNATWSNTSGVSQTYTTDPILQSTWFRAAIKDGGCDLAYSNAVQISVSNPVQPGTVTGDTAICSGQAPGTLTLSGYTGTIVRWEQSVSPYTNWTPLTNATASYAPGALTQSTRYRAIVNTSAGEYPSEYATITITDNPQIGLIAGPGSVCPNQSTVQYSILPVAGATAYAWTLPTGATSAKTDSNVVLVNYSAAAQSGTVSLVVTTNCGDAPPQTLPVTVQSITIGSVTYEEPQTPSSDDGTVTVTLAEGPTEGTILADFNGDGSFEGSGTITNGTIVYSDFGENDVVSSVTVKPVTGCTSAPFATSHTFRAKIRPKLVTPIANPDSGNFATDTIRVYFVSGTQSDLRNIYYTLCPDSINCQITDQNKTPYNTESGILIDISSGRRALSYRAEPKEAYALEYEMSNPGSAFFTYLPDFTIIDGAYYDANGDGRIDGVRVTFDRAPDRAPAALECIEPGNSFDAFPTSSMATAITQIDSITFSADFASEPFSEDLTGFEPGLFCRISDDAALFNTAPFSVRDSVGPVLTSAAYSMSAEKITGASGDYYIDTLTVVFSEPTLLIRTVPMTPFQFINSENELFTLQLNNYTYTGTPITTIRTTVTIDAANGVVPRKNDKVRFMAPNWVSDARGIIQDHGSNKTVPIEVSAPESANTGFQKNPVNPSLNPVPAHILNEINHHTPPPPSHGLVLQVKPNERLANENSELSGIIDIYDGLGNNVLSKAPMLEGAMDHNLYFVWDGKNSKRRDVSSGSYLFMMKYEIDGVLTKKKMMVGISR